MNESQKALKDVAADLQGVTDKAEKGKGPLSGFGSTLGDVGKIASGFVIGAGITAAPGILMGLNSAGKALELQMNKNNIVFGDQITVVKKWAEQNAHSMGLTTTEATSLAAGLADLLIPMGMTREAAADMSTKTIGLSGALAEWSGGTKTAAEVSDILTKAYLGETDGLKALGISISAADVSQRLLEKGQQDLTGAARQQAEALAIQEMVFEKSTDAQTAYANGADSAARKTAESSAKIEEMKDKIAVGLQPVFLAITTVIADKVVPAMESMLGTISSFINYIKIVVTEGDTMNDFLADMPGPLHDIAFEFGKLVLIIKEDVIPLVKEELSAAFAQFQQTLEGLQPVADAILKFFRDNPEAMAAVGVALGLLVIALFPVPAAILAIMAAGTLLMANWDAIRDKVTELLTKFQTDFPILWAVVEFIWNDIKNKIETTMAIIKDVIAIGTALIHGDWSVAWDGVKQLVNDVFDGIVRDVGLKIGLVVDLIKGAAPLALSAAREVGAAIIDGLSAGVSGATSFVSDFASGLGNAIKGWLNQNVIDKINEAIPNKIGIPGPMPDIDIPDNPLPHLALGGIVTRPTLALIGESGPEAVIPLSGSSARGGFGGDIHIHLPEGSIFLGDRRQTIQLAELLAGVLQRRLQTAGGVGLVA